MSEWKIDDQPVEYQIRYWKQQATFLEGQLKGERKRKEPEALRQIERELKDARETVRIVRIDCEHWKKIGLEAMNRVIELESEGAAAVLKRERDHWRDRWRHCTRRLADKIEHLGLDHTGVEPNADQP